MIIGTAAPRLTPFFQRSSHGVDLLDLIKAVAVLSNHVLKAPHLVLGAL